MALRNQPYFPLYVQDFMTDEKLNECSAKANGVYIRLMCLMHKSEEYGTILLKQKYKQNESKIENLLEQKCEQISEFASQLSKNMPFATQEIVEGLTELIEEKVVYIEGDKLIQKRMQKDGIISDKRSSAGSKGAKKKQKDKQISEFASDFASAKPEAKTKQNHEYEYENEIESENTSSIKRIDPYFSNEKIIFENKYKEIFGQAPVLTNEDCLNFSEIASTTSDFFETLEDNLKKTKKLDFKPIGYKPDAGWFLKPKNYAALRNGVYDAQIEENTTNDGFSY